MENESLERVDVTVIDPNPRQIRRFIDPDYMKKLTEGIKNHGLIEPIIIRRMEGGRYQLIAGMQRLQGCKNLGMAHILTVVVDATDQELVSVGLAENIQRNNLSFVELTGGITMSVDAFFENDSLYSSYKSLPLQQRVYDFLSELQRVDAKYENKRQLSQLETDFYAQFHGRVINLFNDLGIDLSYTTFVEKHLSLVISLDSELENLALEHFLKYEQLKAMAMAMVKKDALPVYTKMKINVSTLLLLNLTNLTQSRLDNLLIPII